MKRLLLISFATLVATTASARTFTISGYLRDSVSKEALIGATVHLPQTTQGTSSNQYGFYSITLPEGNVSITCSYVGYTPQTHNLILTADTILNVGLAGATLIGEVVVSATAKAEKIQETTRMSTIKVPIAQIKALPAFLGEVDVLKTLQLMPGIQSGGEGSSGLYVRGGGPDQNLILLDGVPVYNASHLFGFFSVFNADAINNIELLKGGFPSRYGGRVSSVIDINMKEGNMQEWHGEGSVGVVAARLTLEGPLVKDKASFIVSARRTYIDMLIAPIIAAASSATGTDLSVGYYFYDLNAKVNYRLSDRDRIYLSAYMGDDKFYADATTSDYDDTKVRSDNGLVWGNVTTALRWNHVFTNQLFCNTTLTYSRYRMNIYSKNSMSNAFLDADNYYVAMSYLSGIHDWSGRVAFDYLPSPDHYIRFGGTVIRHTFSPGSLGMELTGASFDDLQLPDMSAPEINAWEYDVYVEDDIKLTDKVKTNVGLRASAFATRGKFYAQLEPRISARYLLTDDLAAKAAYSRMTQNVHLLTNAGLGLPTDLWVPTTDEIHPQTSNQVAAGLAYNLFNEYELSMEGYYKTMNNVLEYKEGASTFGNNSKQWESNIIQGQGWSYGVEFFAQKKAGALTGWLGYTLSFTDRQFAELNGGNAFPYRYDRRHDVSVVVAYKVSKRFECSATWVYGTGNSITLPIGVSMVANPLNPTVTKTVYEYGDRNGYRMEPYHRLDLSVTFIKERRRYERLWILSVYNAYNRHNPYYLDVSEGSNSRGTTFKFHQVSLFPIIPSVSYQFRF
jgi:outer membrane receptor for ferrienterochelin and colicin